MRSIWILKHSCMNINEQSDVDIRLLMKDAPGKSKYMKIHHQLPGKHHQFHPSMKPHQSFICIFRSQHQNENFVKELCIPCQSQLHQEPLAINTNLQQPLTRKKGILLKFMKSSSISFFISIKENFSGRSSFSDDPLNFGDFSVLGTLLNGKNNVPTPTFLSSILTITGAIGFWVCSGFFLQVSRVAAATLGF
ncbi:hypothetical protein LR48_Vigan03g207300 [Vigna angularis]|uniref:Uncharacterized protein n=1 Tax=Phaseolus angularis TaxID=3914 RepID=A0A0L9U7F2_PHAAN|nr:hypothetical protein LR48_Vigan03g207300 [Vigna angularis]